MSWWSGQSKEIKVALIGGFFTLTAAVIGVVSDQTSPSGGSSPAGRSSPPPPDPAYCLALLERLDEFLDRDPRNGQVFLHKRADGKPAVAFGADAQSCGLHDPAVLRDLGRTAEPAG